MHKVPERQSHNSRPCGTLLADPCEALGRVLVEIDDTTGTELGSHQGANSLGIKRNVKAFHTHSVS